MALEGRTVLSTRARGQGRELRERLEGLGARVLEVPTIEIVPPASWEPVDEAIRRIAEYDWVIFTSANAVEAFLSRAGSLPPIQVAAVGSQTARKLTEKGCTPDLVPIDFRAEGLLEALPDNLTGKRILIPRAQVAREYLPEHLRGRGARVDVVTVYRTERPPEGAIRLARVLQDENVDCIMLTSGSTVHNLAEMLGVSDLSHALAGIAIAVIGPVTRDSATDAGLEVDIQAEKSTVPDLVEAIRNHYEIQRKS